MECSDKQGLLCVYCELHSQGANQPDTLQFFWARRKRPDIGGVQSSKWFKFHLQGLGHSEGQPHGLHLVQVPYSANEERRWVVPLRYAWAVTLGQASLLKDKKWQRKHRDYRSKVMNSDQDNWVIYDCSWKLWSELSFWVMRPVVPSRSSWVFQILAVTPAMRQLCLASIAKKNLQAQVLVWLITASCSMSWSRANLPPLPSSFFKTERLLTSMNVINGKYPLLARESKRLVCQKCSWRFKHPCELVVTLLGISLCRSAHSEEIQRCMFLFSCTLGTADRHLILYLFSNPHRSVYSTHCPAQTRRKPSYNYMAPWLQWRCSYRRMHSSPKLQEDSSPDLPCQTAWCGM